MRISQRVSKVSVAVVSRSLRVAKRGQQNGHNIDNTMKVIPRTALICVAAAVYLNYRATAEIQPDGACPLLVLLPFSTTYVLFSQLRNRRLSALVSYSVLCIVVLTIRILLVCCFVL